jgi:hypothetical protein
VSGLEYSYTHASKTLIISKTSGTFNPADVAKIVEAIQSLIGTHNQIIQAIAIDIACAGD